MRLPAAITRGITRNVVALGFVSLLTDISSEMLVYVVPLFLANVIAATASIIGLIEGVAESTAALIKLVSGRISDRLGRRRLLVGLGYGGSVVAKSLYLVATTWPVVLLARIGDRIGKGIRVAPRDALIADSTAPEFRGTAFGLHRAMDTVGAIVGVSIAAIVVSALQGDAVTIEPDVFRTLALVALVPGILALGVIGVGVRDVPIIGRAARGASSASAPPAPPAFVPVDLERRLRGFPVAFWVFVAASGLFALGNSSDAFLSLRSQQLGVSVRDILLMVVAFNVSNAVIAWPIGALSDRVGRRRLIAIAWAIYALAYAGFAFVSGPVPVTLLWVLYGAYYGVNEAVGKALVADLAPAPLRATAYGILNAVVGLALLPASIVAGLLWDGVSPAAPFWFGAACAASALLLLAFVRLPARPTTAAP